MIQIENQQNSIISSDRQLGVSNSNALDINQPENETKIISWRNIKKKSKLYIIFCDFGLDKDIFRIIFEKILICNLLDLVYSISIIATYYVSFYLI